jgi:hypothetical protein
MGIRLGFLKNLKLIWIDKNLLEKQKSPTKSGFILGRIEYLIGLN